MRDLGHEETEEVLKKIEKRISQEYRQAEREIAAKLDDYMKRFAEKDKLKLLGVANGQITEEEYKQWRLGQVMIGKRWSEMRDSLAKDFANTSQIARSIAFDHIPEVYAINHDYGTFQVEKGSLTDTSYTLYDRQSIEQLYKNEDTFIPAPGRQVKRAINEGKQIAWDKKQVQSVMMQGLLQGESIPNIATRLAKSVGEGDRKAAIRNARTLTTGIENAGRIASYDRANAMGIKTKKQWLAALDMRTRHWHASLDGVSVDNDKPFTNDYGKIMYPGDPSADPANIFNCRCTLIADIEGFENDLSDMSLRHNEKLGDMSYDEWKKGHYTTESDPITKQDEIAETMKRVYGAEYAKYKKTDKELQNGKNRGIISSRQMSNGTRKSQFNILSSEEQNMILGHAKELKIPESVLRFNYGDRTGFLDSEKIIGIRGDIMPDLGSTNLRDRLSIKAVLAHEYYGHYKKFPSPFQVGDWRDEFNASYMAALNAPNLSDEDRRMLMLDAFDRAKEAGVIVKYNYIARRIIYGYE